MTLSESNPIGWRKWILLLWAVIEIVLFSGIMFGWGVLVFVLKDEGLYSNLCAKTDIENHSSRRNSTTINNSTADPNNAEIGTLSVVSTSMSTSFAEAPDNVCKPQDEKMAMCFTIASALFCVAAPFIGHINYKFGTRVYRLIGL